MSRQHVSSAQHSVEKILVQFVTQLNVCCIPTSSIAGSGWKAHHDVAGTPPSDVTTFCATLLPEAPQRRFSVFAALLVKTGLRDVRRQHYSAERMSLVVLGGQSLDELADAVQRLFSAVPFGRGPRPEFSSAGRPFKVRLQAVKQCPVLSSPQPARLSLLL
jgi:hypothetical protein